MTILAIDPGPEKSAVLCYDGTVRWSDFMGNYDVLGVLGGTSKVAMTCAIEKVESFGMAVGRSVFDTVHWAGRFHQAVAARCMEIPAFDAVLVPRKDVKLHLCGSMRAKDTNIRQAILDRFGGKEAAIGLKATPGPLYGIKSHSWAALALALTVWDQSPRSA